MIPIVLAVIFIILFILIINIYNIEREIDMFINIYNDENQQIKCCNCKYLHNGNRGNWCESENFSVISPDTFGCSQFQQKDNTIKTS